MLEQEGLAVTIPRRGAEVAKMTEKDMQDVLQVREALDELAASIACELITEEEMEQLEQAAEEFETATNTKDIKRIADTDMTFHDIIYHATRNPKLVNILNNLREQMYRYRVEYLKDEQNYPVLLKEHGEILAGFRERNKDMVTDSMRKHVVNQAAAVKTMIQNQE